MGMFEKPIYRCPQCSVELLEDYAEKSVYACPECTARFKALADKESGRVALIEVDERTIPEPLYLPRGSIRAITTLSMAISCWIMVLAGRDVPSYLFSLLLAILGYYFGFRTKMKSAQSRLIDATAEALEPLYLPGGLIRALLIAGFLVAGLVLLERGRFASPDLIYLEFFVIFAGLVVGHVFACLLARARATPLTIATNHVKGLLVLVVCALLCYLFLGGGHAQHPKESMLLCAAVSFYFGSRT